MQGFVRMMRVDLGYARATRMSVGIPVHDNTYTTWELGERTSISSAESRCHAGSCFRGLRQMPPAKQ